MLPVLRMRLKNFFEYGANDSSAKIDIDSGVVCCFGLPLSIKGMWLILLALAGLMQIIITFQGAIHNVSFCSGNSL